MVISEYVTRNHKNESKFVTQHSIVSQTPIPSHLTWHDHFITEWPWASYFNSINILFPHLLNWILIPPNCFMIILEKHVAQWLTTSECSKLSHSCHGEPWVLCPWVSSNRGCKIVDLSIYHSGWDMELDDLKF